MTLDETIRNSVWAAKIFMTGFYEVMEDALMLNQGILNPAETVVIGKLINILSIVKDPNGSFDWAASADVFKSDILSYVNAEFKKLVSGGTTEDFILGAMVKSYNIVLNSARSHIQAGLADNMIDIVCVYLSWSHRLPQGGTYLDMMDKFNKYVSEAHAKPDFHLITSSKFAVLPKKDQDWEPNKIFVDRDPPRTFVPNKEPIDRDHMTWVTNAAMSSILVRIMDVFYNFQAKFTVNDRDHYCVDLDPIIAKYKNGTGVVSSTARDGIDSILYALKQPTWNMGDAYYLEINEVCTGTTALTKVDDLLKNHISINKCSITNYMPFRAWFDMNNMNGDSVWQFREGDQTKGINDDIYSIQMNKNVVYPTRHILLNGNDSCFVTNIDGVALVNIIKDGERQPDLYFLSGKVY
jgi:hypothetical protein